MNAIRAVVVCSLLLGCGDGGPGAPGSFNPPTRGGNTPFAGSGSDKSGGGDRGGGGTSALGGVPGSSGGPSAQASPPSTCVTSEECIGGRCSRSSSAAVGYCIQDCAEVACGSGYECVASESGRLCLAPCTTSAECPRVGGFTASCVTVTEVGRFCIWSASQQS